MKERDDVLVLRQDVRNQFYGIALQLAVGVFVFFAGVLWAHRSCHHHQVAEHTEQKKL